MTKCIHMRKTLTRRSIYIQNKYSLLLLFIVLLSLPVAIFVANRTSRLITSRAASANIYFNPATASVKSGSNLTITVYINTGTTGLGFAHTDIVFDRSKLRLASEPTSSSKLTRVLTKTTKSQTDSCSTTCRITLAQELDPGSKSNPPMGIIDIVRLTFTPVTTLNKINTTISIDGNTDKFVDMGNTVFSTTLGTSVVTINPTTSTPTPTRTPTPTKTPSAPTSGPTPTPYSGTVYRAFKDTSYWNNPMPVNAPIDPNNATYIADAKNLDRSTAFLKLAGAPGHAVGDDWAYPIYWAETTDPWYTITPDIGGPTVQARIPRGATPQAGSDGGIIIYDLAADQVIEMYQARYDSSADKWSSTSTKRYILSSNGLEKNAAGSDSQLNVGHRGVASPIRAIRRDEVRSGHIAHRLECFWHDTAEKYYWPMVGYESGKGGVTPEGLVLRLKPGVNLDDKGLSFAEKVIARAMQEYGCIIGDNEGGRGNTIKLERGKAEWGAFDPDMWFEGLNVFTWDDYEFIQGGYDPVSGTIK